MQFIGPREAARRLDVGFATTHRWCKQFDGFAVWVDGHWRIPADHVDRVQAGELPSQIARRPSLPADNATSADSPAEDAPVLFNDEPAAAVADAERDAQQDDLRHRLLRCYLFSLGLKHHDDELSDAKRQSVVWSVSEDLLAIIRTMGIVPTGGLKTALRNSGVLNEYRALSGVEAEI